MYVIVRVTRTPLALSRRGAGVGYRFTGLVPHDEQQWQYLDDLVAQAREHWDAIPEANRDFELAKAVLYPGGDGVGNLT